MTTFDIIVKARKILSDPRRWTKNRYKGVNKDGEVCYCALGALAAAAGVNGIRATSFEQFEGPEWDSYVAARRAVQQHVPEVESYSGYLYGPSVHRFNDLNSTSYEDVMKLLSDAAAAEVTKA